MKTYKQQIIENTVDTLVSAGMPRNFADLFSQMLSNVYDCGYLEAMNNGRENRSAPYVPGANKGCSVCGIGANGEVIGYVCPRDDCPTKIIVKDAIL